MARKSGKACGYANGGRVADGGSPDIDDDEADAIINEEDYANRRREQDSRPSDVEQFNKFAEEMGPEAMSAYSARHRFKDRTRRSVLKADETRPQRAAREQDEADEAAEQKIEDERQRRRDYVKGKLRDI